MHFRGYISIKAVLSPVSITPLPFMTSSRNWLDTIIIKLKLELKETNIHTHGRCESNTGAENRCLAWWMKWKVIFWKHWETWLDNWRRAMKTYIFGSERERERKRLAALRITMCVSESTRVSLKAKWYWNVWNSTTKTFLEKKKKWPPLWECVRILRSESKREHVNKPS